MLKRFVLGATLLAVLVAPATAQSPLDWVPPPEAAQWAPGTTENLAIVRRVMPGLTGQELEKAQFQVAVDMAMLTALVGRAGASYTERSWENYLTTMYDLPRYNDQANKRWGINPSGAERLMRTTGRPLTAMIMITQFIAKREELEDRIATGTDQKIAENRVKLRYLAEDTRKILGDAASDAILTRDSKYLGELQQTIVDAGYAAARSRAKESDPSNRGGKR